MNSILIAGNGPIGSAIAQLLAKSGQYHVTIGDITIQSPMTQGNVHYEPLDVQNRDQFSRIIKHYKINAVIACLPYFININVAQLAKDLNLHYFDLTEDISTTEAIAQLANGAQTAFIPQCGLAPGFINIVAADLMQQFDQLDTVRLRCGALPAQVGNALQYALTWSIDGLINEYGNPCQVINDGKSTTVPPLCDLEEVIIEGVQYEAFNTSGGIGTLTQAFGNQVHNLNYKTLRYPGHCQKMAFLMNDLQLNDDRENLKNILQKCLPSTTNDRVLVLILIQGLQKSRFCQQSFSAKFTPHLVDNQPLTAIQMSTGSSVCAVLDLVMKQPHRYQGFIHQHQFNLKDFLNNPFGCYFN